MTSPDNRPIRLALPRRFLPPVTILPRAKSRNLRHRNYLDFILTGMEVVVRKPDWGLIRALIEDHGTLTYRRIAQNTFRIRVVFEGVSRTA